MAVLLRHAEIVLQRFVRRLERIVELVTLEDIVLPPLLVARAVLRVDRATHGPERTFLAFDPDQDRLLGPRVVDAVNDPLGEAARR